MTPEPEVAILDVDKNNPTDVQALDQDQEIFAAETHNLGPKSTLLDFAQQNYELNRQALFVVPTVRINSLPSKLLPNALFKLFTEDDEESRDFRQNIRLYNSI
ncbi:hypothetical protein PoB_002220400 [Plakobranchus ocellatus]|uniref:Uncharacterized protein n=1 Tax=Plakobranchus ocellatus TaxID=259542 RepID=A0AAV3ZK32_9GAST|nr:hypothetical protein PoB_002220400 [Plakobranchus ocellatus]